MFGSPGARQGPGFFPQMKIRYLITTRTAKAGAIADVEEGHGLALVAHRYAVAVRETAAESTQANPVAEVAAVQPVTERAIRPISKARKTAPAPAS